MSIRFPFGRFVLALAVGTAGGALFAWMQAPLPFMLGSMAFCMAAAVAGLPVDAPKAVRPPMSAVIGAMLGTAFTAEVLADIPGWWGTALAMVGFIAVAGLVCVTILHRVMRYDMQTAYFCGMPGGLVDMTTLGDAYGADVRRVAMVHSTRILIIVFALPLLIRAIAGDAMPVGAVAGPSILDTPASFYLWFAGTVLVGAVVGHVLHLPAKFIMGPLSVSAFVHMMGWTDYVLPVELVILAQVVLGTTIGCRFVGTTLAEVARISGAGVVTTAALIGVTLVFAWGTGWATGRDPVAVLLAFAPGGFAEMGLIALALGIDTVFVAAHHILRIALVSFGGAMVFRIWRGPPPVASGPTPPGRADGDTGTDTGTDPPDAPR